MEVIKRGSRAVEIGIPGQLGKHNLRSKKLSERDPRLAQADVFEKELNQFKAQLVSYDLQHPKAKGHQPRKRKHGPFGGDAGSSDDWDYDENFPVGDGTPRQELVERIRLWTKYLDYARNDYAEDLRKRDLKCAEAAIAYYNDKHGTDYELVQTLGSSVSYNGKFWYHCNFRAQRKGKARVPELFFAELCGGDFCVTFCELLASDKVKRCKVCPDYILHPSGGFEVGCYK